MRPGREGGLRAGPAVHNVWALDLHLHFGWLVAARRRSLPPLALAAGARLAWRRSSALPVPAVGAAAPPALHSGLARRSTTEPRPPRTAAPGLRSSETNTVRSPRRPFVAPLVPRLRAAAWPPSGNSSRAFAAPGPVRGSGARTAATGARLRATEVLVRYRRTFVLPGAAPAARAVAPTPGAQWSRVPDLIWSAARGISAGAARPVPAAAASVWPGRPPRPAPEPGTAVETSLPAASAAATRITSLDPALVDRLTDDVIRRVERRVRIERERRGI